MQIQVTLTSSIVLTFLCPYNNKSTVVVAATKKRNEHIIILPKLEAAKDSSNVAALNIQKYQLSSIKKYIENHPCRIKYPGSSSQCKRRMTRVYYRNEYSCLLRNLETGHSMEKIIQKCDTIGDTMWPGYLGTASENGGNAQRSMTIVDHAELLYIHCNGSRG